MDNKYTIEAPRTPGGARVVVETAPTIVAARDVARRFRTGRGDLTYQDVSIRKRVDPYTDAFVEYAGPPR